MLGADVAGRHPERVVDPVPVADQLAAANHGDAVQVFDCWGCGGGLFGHVPSLPVARSTCADRRIVACGGAGRNRTRARRGTVKGSGLGLAIAKEIARRHGIGLSVNSAEGQGAAFVFDFGGGEKLSDPK